MSDQDGGRSFVQNFCMLPLDLLADRRLTPSDKIVGWTLVAYAGEGYECAPTDKMLAQDTRMGERTIRTSLNKLEDTEWIKRVSRNDIGKPRVIQLLWRRAGQKGTAKNDTDPADFDTRQNLARANCRPTGCGLPSGRPWAAAPYEEERERNSFSRALTRPKDPDEQRWGGDGNLPCEQWSDSTLAWQLDEIEKALPNFEETHPTHKSFIRMRGRILDEMSRRAEAQENGPGARQSV